MRLPEERRRLYLDELLHGDEKPSGRVHLLGIGQHDWYGRYDAATEGDCTSWIPRSDWNRRKSIEEWMQAFGEVEIPFTPPVSLQTCLWEAMT